MHPLRKLRETGPRTIARLKALLAENVVFYSPVLAKPVEGREKVAAIFAASPAVRQGSYVAEYTLDNRNTFLRWKGTFHGYEIESLEVLTDNTQGLLVERTVAYRPFPALRILREEMYKDLKNILGPEYWEYPSGERP